MYTLRKPLPEDEYFLFMAMQLAMLPTKQKMNPEYELNLEREYKKYSSPFTLNEVDIIQSNGIDIGRLRIVKTSEHIYIGAFQILPEFQNRGIGTAILIDLVKESKLLNVPILLEVQKVNLQAKAFYERHGFNVIGDNDEDFSMIFQP